MAETLLQHPVLTNFVYPFLIVFFIVFAILEKTKLFGEEKKQLKSLFEWHKAENRKMHPLELVALVHLKLVSLQPFVDGNSRLSRLLMNWVLWKKNYPLIDIPANDLENYYNVLDKYQIEKDEKPFIQYIKQKYLGG